MGISIFLILGGGILIWLSARQSSLYLRRMGLGLILAGFALIILGRLNVQLIPN